MALTINDYGNRIMVSGTPVATDVITERVERLQGIEWRNPVAADDVVTLVDSAGSQIVTATCLAAKEPIYLAIPQGIWVNGISCSALDSGTLMIYFV